MLHIDPREIGQFEAYHFDQEVFDKVEADSRAIARIGTRVLDQSHLYRDSGLTTYGRESATNVAREMMSDLAGSGAEIVVETLLTHVPVFLDTQKEPPYPGMVQVFRVPQHWNQIYPKTDTTMVRETLFTTWRNGASTPQAAELDILLLTLQDNDQTGALRKRPNT